MFWSVLSALLLGVIPAPLLSQPDSSFALHSLDIVPPTAQVALESRVTASGVIVVDLKSGQRLFAKDAQVPRPLASLTKLMTALIIVENHDLSEWVSIPKTVRDTEGTVAYLPSGQDFTVGDLLSALLMGSANDAAVTLAMYHSGSLREFVEEMNARAKSLGLKNTSFANPSGLDDADQYASPQDISWLVMAARRHPSIRERMGKRGTTIRSRQGTEIAITHTHALLHAPQGHDALAVTGGKTGTTLAAGENLVSILEGRNRIFLVVLLRSSERYADMRKILNDLASHLAPPPKTVACEQGACGS